MNIPRNEHPNPQFEREDCVCLNGLWDFEIDNSRSGEARKMYEQDSVFSGKILVPFCPESSLSGVCYKDFMYGVWYKRSFSVPAEKLGGRTVLHIGACDYNCIIYINGQRAGEHAGGYISFETDITAFVHENDNTLTIYARDDTRDPLIPRGKQSEEFYSHHCDYTRTTGIWQTVWLEFKPQTYIANVKFYPDPESCSVTIFASLCGKGSFCAEAFYEGRSVGLSRVEANGGHAQLTLALSEKHLWEVGHGRLYDIKLSFGEDSVSSYFGLRSVCLDGYKFLINGVSVFQRLILDQGFYPDGIYTAPSDAELHADILRSQAMGFNGARLHQKIFEQRFLYHADKEGYIVWGEYPNWGLDHSRPDAIYSFLPEWTEELERDFNHPSIIGWCPFNETWDYNNARQNDEFLRIIYKTTKAIDSTRPCIDTSGNFHVETDIYDVHNYEQNPEILKKSYDTLMEDGTLFDLFTTRQTYTVGTPTFVSEYGGTHWAPENTEGWGYGKAPESEKDFLERYKGLTDALLDNSRMFGFCYTQLTDVEQEKNGLYTYDRKAKFNPAVIKEITARKAAIED